MIPPHSSLVKYDNPILVSTTKDGSNDGKKDKGGKKGGGGSSNTEDILNSILPPREWTEVRCLSWHDSDGVGGTRGCDQWLPHVHTRTTVDQTEVNFETDLTAASPSSV
jgi:hypothetical protein